MTLLMYDEHPLILDKKLAKAIGLNQAMILQQVHYWLEKNKKDGRNLHEGRYWTYNTIDEWQEEFPFWSRETVKRTFSKLREMGFLLVGNFNVYKMDRTLWYTIDYDKLNECIGLDKINEGIENDPKEDIQTETMEDRVLTSPIPEISSETTKEIFNQSVNQDQKEDTIKGQMDRKTYINKDINEEYKDILDKCQLFAIDENYRDAVAHVIRLLLLDVKKDQKLKIGENYYPAQMVREDLNKLNFHIVQHGVNKFKEASEVYEIKNTIAYLKACIYNAIHEMNIDVDSKLRSFGLI